MTGAASSRIRLGWSGAPREARRTAARRTGGPALDHVLVRSCVVGEHRVDRAFAQAREDRLIGGSGEHEEPDVEWFQ
jgi:hypothetical protein